jgi:hypothetical protein
MLPVISNDGSYGNKIGGRFSPYGVDDIGTKKARAMDMEIITSCLVNGISNEKKTFTEIYSKKNDYKEYMGVVWSLLCHLD